MILPYVCIGKWKNNIVIPRINVPSFKQGPQDAIDIIRKYVNRMTPYGYIFDVKNEKASMGLLRQDGSKVYEVTCDANILEVEIGGVIVGAKCESYLPIGGSFLTYGDIITIVSREEKLEIGKYYDILVTKSSCNLDLPRYIIKYRYKTKNGHIIKTIIGSRILKTGDGTNKKYTITDETGIETELNNESIESISQLHRPIVVIGKEFKGYNIDLSVMEYQCPIKEFQYDMSLAKKYDVVGGVSGKEDSTQGGFPIFCAEMLQLLSVKFGGPVIKFRLGYYEKNKEYAIFVISEKPNLDTELVNISIDHVDQYTKNIFMYVNSLNQFYRDYDAEHKKFNL
jgi:hypothetical protein